MKKLFKALLVGTCVCTMGAGLAAATGCDNSKNSVGEAYGLVHSAGYVGYSTVTVKGDEVKDVTLTEVCFPTQVKKEDGSYYATVTYGDVTMTYDAEVGYKVGTQTLKEYFKTEANCKAYYEAVIGGKVKADGADNVMTKAALCKDDNGYWTRGKDANNAWGRVNNPATETTYVNNQYSRWKQNRDATVNYAKTNGIEKLLLLVQPSKKNEEGKDVLVKNGTDVTEGSQVTYWVDGTISTGATWTDLNSVKEGSTSYAQLITNAYQKAANVKVYGGEYKYENTYEAGTYYGVAVQVTVKDGKISKVTYGNESDVMHNITPTWQENKPKEGALGAEKTKAALDGYITEKFVGKSVADIKALTVATSANGAPDTANTSGYTDYILTGATQTSGRLVLAIKDALKNA